VNKFYITTPIFYLNGSPHIGHAYTTVAADVLARFQRQNKQEVFFLTGTDEHGAKIAKSAQKANMEVHKFCDKNAQAFLKLWEGLGISYDDFLRTSEPRHEEAVKEFLNQLKSAKTPKNRPALYEDEYSGLYCEGCEAYKTESDIENGLCPEHKIKPITLKERNWFFRLLDFEESLKKQIGLKKMKIMPEGRQKEVAGFIKHGLTDIAISRANVPWGIKVPFDESQTVYVWVDALINYLSALGWPKSKKFEKFWPADLHLIGKDILKFHAVIWPALLMALKIELPKSIFAHGYFTVGDEKMSKSVGNVISPEHLIKQFGADATRYLLLSLYPFGQDGDITIEKINLKYKSALANGLGNLVSRVLNLVETEFEGVIPVAVPSPRNLKNRNKLLENEEIYEAIGEIEDAVAFANQYIEKNKLWQIVKTKKEEAGIILSGLCALICEIAKYIDPIMPNISKDITDRLSAKKITKGEPLFPIV